MRVYYSQRALDGIARENVFGRDVICIHEHWTERIKPTYSAATPLFVKICHPERVIYIYSTQWPSRTSCSYYTLASAKSPADLLAGHNYSPVLEWERDRKIYQTLFWESIHFLCKLDYSRVINSSRLIVYIVQDWYLKYERFKISFNLLQLYINYKYIRLIERSLRS